MIKEYIPIMAAAIAASSSLVVVVLQAILHAKNSRKIEELKLQFDQNRNIQAEYIKTYLTLIAQGRTQELQAFTEVLRHVQGFRDGIRMLVTRPQSDSAGVRQEIGMLTNRVMTAYADNQLSWGETDRALVHELKTLVVKTGEYLIREHRDIASAGVQHKLEPMLVEMENFQRQVRHRAANATNAVMEDVRRGVSLARISHRQSGLETKST
jgi:hypothetical protein